MEHAGWFFDVWNLVGRWGVCGGGPIVWFEGGGHLGGGGVRRGGHVGTCK